MPPKQLKDLTVQEFVSTEISAINTFPYRPSGLLTKHSRGAPTADTDKLMQNYLNDLKETDRFVERFSEKQKTSLGWVMAGLIGVLGNLAVNFGFSNPIIGVNLFWMVLALIVVALVIGFYLSFLPRVIMVFRFIPNYMDFPKGYEQYIPQASCSNPYSNIIFQFQRLDETVRNFGVTVKLAILKDCIINALKKSSCVRISSVQQRDQYLPFVTVEVSLKGIKLWFRPKVQNELAAELRELALAFMNAHQLCSVRAFELDSVEWQNHGVDFVDAVSSWDFDAVQRMLVSLIKEQKIDNLP
jgi:hypothetical protein